MKLNEYRAWNATGYVEPNCHPFKYILDEHELCSDIVTVVTCSTWFPEFTSSFDFSCMALIE